MISTTFNLIIGITGMLSILIAFVMEDFGKIQRGGLIYNLLNLFGSLLLIFYAVVNKAIVFVFLNVFWAVIAVYFLIRKNKQ